MPPSPRTALPEKTCAACGRRIVWRRRWARSWQAVRYCGERCRRSRRARRGTDARLEEAIRSLLAVRARDASLCPSEAARAVGGSDWRALMEPAREAARRLVARGEVEVTQRGRVLDPSRARGPIRIRRARAGARG
ncbi:MAG: DUF3253 domain-containing protein [Myxococcota bacterium]|nr:DUF3253 domain-containing protein [Myxococcota bacterium]